MNPYIRRHSALTEKSKILKEHVLRQHAGWTATSNMPEKYIHYFGNESNESILEAYGLIDKNKQEIDKLKPKQCPNWYEDNKIDSKFCSKCRMVLSYDAYTQVRDNSDNKNDEVAKLTERLDLMSFTLNDLSNTVRMSMNLSEEKMKQIRDQYSNMSISERNKNAHKINQ